MLNENNITLLLMTTATENKERLRTYAKAEVHRQGESWRITCGQ